MVYWQECDTFCLEHLTSFSFVGFYTMNRCISKTNLYPTLVMMWLKQDFWEQAELEFPLWKNVAYSWTSCLPPFRTVTLYQRNRSHSWM